MDTKTNKKLGKEVVNIIRTAMRNNIELTQISDNKANVLLSINALIVTLLVPIILYNVEIIKQIKMWIPLTILVLTAVITIYLAVLILMPRGFSIRKKPIQQSNQKSPFFFGNFYQMEKEAYQSYFRESVADIHSLHDHIIEDMYFVGSVLGRKMTLIRLAFRIFLAGFLLAVFIALILFILYG